MGVGVGGVPLFYRQATGPECGHDLPRVTELCTRLNFRPLVLPAVSMGGGSPRPPSPVPSHVQRSPGEKWGPPCGEPGFPREMSPGPRWPSRLWRLRPGRRPHASLPTACWGPAPPLPHTAGPAQSTGTRVEDICGHPPTQFSEKAPTLLFQPPGEGGGMATPSAAGASASPGLLCGGRALRPGRATQRPAGLPRGRAPAPTATAAPRFRGLSARGALRAGGDPYLPARGLPYGWGFVI